jgi:hypothetical protein
MEKRGQEKNKENESPSHVRKKKSQKRHREKSKD